MGLSKSVICAVAWLGVATVLAGCDSQPNAHALYIERLASALGVSAEQAVSDQQTPAGGLFPAPNTLAIERVAEKIDLLDFLQVHRCDMGALVGARNGSLGRVQSASQRWLYDLQLVQGLRACEELTPPLQELIERRQAELGTAAFNALFSGKEWHAFATPPLAQDSMSFDPAMVERALLALTAMVEAVQEGAVTPAGMESLEEHLAVLKFSAALGQQRRAWAQQAATLEQATHMLSIAFETNPACRSGKPTPAGRIRQNVFEQFYVNALQPELAQQGQADRGWVKAVAMLVATTLAASRSNESVQNTAASLQLLAVQDFHDRVLGDTPKSEFGRWKRALAAHSRAWQRQLSLCGLMPTLAVQRPI